MSNIYNADQDIYPYSIIIHSNVDIISQDATWYPDKVYVCRYGNRTGKITIENGCLLLSMGTGMTYIPLTNIYKIHLVRKDGLPLDTPMTDKKS